MTSRYQPREYLRVLRPHQWAKNALILLPGLAAHVTAPASYGRAALAVLAFCFCASAAYVMNDLFDLRHDREHATKRSRPLAAGTVPVGHGLILVPILLVAGFLVASVVSLAFDLVLAGYFIVTTAYSLALKRMLALDVITLACLYGVRVAAGGVAFMVPLSEWLVAFSVFLFLCLALIKRIAELAARERAGKADPPGRPYRLSDQSMLEAMAAASGMAAVVVLALYVNNPLVTELYLAPQALWGVGVVLAYWLCRVLILTHRGEMLDDPVAFALTDRVSFVCGVLGAIIVLGAAL